MELNLISNNIVTVILTEGNYNEVTKGYREKLVDWVDWGIVGLEALTDYKRLGWKVRLIGAEG